MDPVSSPAGRRFGAGLLVLVSFGGIGLWQALQSDGPPKDPVGSAPPARTPPRDPRSVPVVPRVDPRQSTSFRLLRTKPEGIPPTMKRILRKPVYGLNWALAQRVPEAVSADYWVVPGKGTLCILSQMRDRSVSMTCATTRQAIDHGVAAVSLHAEAGSRDQRGRRLVVGVAPDRARRIRADTAGSTTTVPVVGGVFTLRDSVMNPPDTLTPVAAPASRTTGRTDLPPAAAP